MSYEPNKPAAEQDAERAKAGAGQNPEGVSRTEWLKTWLPLITGVSAAVLSAAVTAVFGFFIWKAQTSIQAQVNHNNELIRQQAQMQVAQFQSQLSLKETFYKRRLEIYEQACQRVAAAEKVLAEADLTPGDLAKATDLVPAFDEFRRGNQLYWSQQLNDHLEELWLLGARKLNPLEPGRENLNEEIAKEVEALHTQMKEDLYLAQLAMTLQELGKGPPEGKQGPSGK